MASTTKYDLDTVPDTTDWLETVEENLRAIGSDDETSGNPEESNQLASKLIFTAGDDLDAFDVVFLTEYKAVVKASSTPAGGFDPPAIGVVLKDVIDGNPAIVQMEGLVENPDWAWTPGDRLFVSETVAGQLQTTISPNRQNMGFAVTATQIYLTGNMQQDNSLYTTSTTTSTSTSSSTTTTTA